jgi:hypothetical protein
MKRPALFALTTLLFVLCLSAGHQSQIASASQNEAVTVVGLWSGTLFYGDPANPATPTEQFLANVDPHGTYSVDSTAATGSHPLNSGAKTEERGVWERRDRRVTTHGFWFDEGGFGLGFSLGRGATVLEFAARDRLTGYADVDFLPCPSGPLGCPDPVDVGALSVGAGLGPFPVVLNRIR